MSVFVVQEVPGRNILGARSYGDLRVLLPSNTNIVLSPGPTIRRLREGLKEFNNQDYLFKQQTDNLKKDKYGRSRSHRTCLRNRQRYKCWLV